MNFSNLRFEDDSPPDDHIDDIHIQDDMWDVPGSSYDANTNIGADSLKGRQMMSKLLGEAFRGSINLSDLTPDHVDGATPRDMKNRSALDTTMLESFCGAMRYHSYRFVRSSPSRSDLESRKIQDHRDLCYYFLRKRHCILDSRVKRSWAFVKSQLMTVPLITDIGMKVLTQASEWALLMKTPVDVVSKMITGSILERRDVAKADLVERCRDISDPIRQNLERCMFWTLLVFLANSKSFLEKSEILETFKEFYCESDFRIVESVEFSHIQHWILDIMTPYGLITLTPELFILHDYGYWATTMYLLDIKEATWKMLVPILVGYNDPMGVFTPQSVDYLLRLQQIMIDEAYKQGNHVYTMLKSGYPVCEYKCIEISNNWMNEQLDWEIANKFKDYILNLKETLKLEKGVDMGQFYDFLFSINDPQELYNLYCCFKMFGAPEGCGIKSFQAVIAAQENRRELVMEDIYKVTSTYAKKVILGMRKRLGRWPLRLDDIRDDHVIKPYVAANCDLPATLHSHPQLLHLWHTLPIEACMEIPENLALNTLIDDKSICKTKSEMMKDYHKPGRSPYAPFATKKLILESMKQEVFNMREFLLYLDMHGLDEEHKVAVVRAKEWELKVKFRMFIILTFVMRMLVVSISYLFKKNIKKFFPSITMGASSVELKKSLLQMTSHHGKNVKGGEVMSMGSHMDRQKWCSVHSWAMMWAMSHVNNQLFGFKRLFHLMEEGFQGLISMYMGAPEIWENDGEGFIRPKLGYEGAQYKAPFDCGSFEGMNTGPWTAYTQCALETAAVRTNLVIIAKRLGDNDAVRASAKLRPCNTESELRDEKNRVAALFTETLKDVIQLEESAGHTLKLDECSAGVHFLVYNRIILVCGRFLEHTCRAWGSLTFGSNDLDTGLKDSLSNVNNCLNDEASRVSCLDRSLCNLAFMKCFMLAVADVHDPGVLTSWTRVIKTDNSDKYYIERAIFNFLYKDPSIGGATGKNGFSLLSVGFPDHVNQSLTMMYKIEEMALETGDEVIAMFAAEGRSPRVETGTRKTFSQVLENPASLNIPGAKACDNVVKMAVDVMVELGIFKVKNEAVQTLFRHQGLLKESMLDFLWNNVKYPNMKVLSKINDAGIHSYISSVLGSIRSSKTLVSNARLTPILQKYLHRSVVLLTIGMYRMQSEYNGTIVVRTSPGKFQAEAYAKWAPHMELQNPTVVCAASVAVPGVHFADSCSVCHNLDDLYDSFTRNSYIQLVVGRDGLSRNPYEVGEFTSFQGSDTVESHDGLASYEKVSKATVLRDWLKLRKLKSWIFEDGDYFPEETISNALESYSGYDYSEKRDIKSAQSGHIHHRFNSSRLSSGCFITGSPFEWKKIKPSADFMELGGLDMNIMFQECLAYALQVGYYSIPYNRPGAYHVHFSSSPDLVEVSDKKMKTLKAWKPMSIHKIVEKIFPFDMEPDIEVVTHELKIVDWDQIGYRQANFALGFNQGLMANAYLELDHEGRLEAMFPIGNMNKILPKVWAVGLAFGLYIGGAMTCEYRFIPHNPPTLRSMINSQTKTVIGKLAKEGAFITYVRAGPIMEMMSRKTSTAPQSFPVEDEHCTKVAYLFLSKLVEEKSWTKPFDNMNVFSKDLFLLFDTASPLTIWMTLGGLEVLRVCDNNPQTSYNAYEKARNAQGLEHFGDSDVLHESLSQDLKAGVAYFKRVKTQSFNDTEAIVRYFNGMDMGSLKNVIDLDNLQSSLKAKMIDHLKKAEAKGYSLRIGPTDSRSCLKKVIFDSVEEVDLTDLKFYSINQNKASRKEYVPETFYVEVDLKSNVRDEEMVIVPRQVLPCVVTAGLFTYRIPARSHHKLESILSTLEDHGMWEKTPTGDFMCTGDGTGGFTAKCLSRWRQGRCLYNSLINFSESSSHGESMSMPPSIVAIGKEGDRCLNAKTATERPSDLAKQETWNYFIEEILENRMSIELFTCDAEGVWNLENSAITNTIEALIAFNMKNILVRGACVIYKGYYSRERFQSNNILFNWAGNNFMNVYAFTSLATSYGSTEFYIVCVGYGYSPLNGSTLKVSNESIKHIGHIISANRRRDWLVEKYHNLDPMGMEALASSPTDYTSLIRQILFTAQASTVHEETLIAFNDEWNSCIEEGVAKMLTVAILVTSNITNWTKWFYKGDVYIPSDSRLSLILAWVHALGCFLGIATNDPSSVEKSERFQTDKHKFVMSMKSTKDPDKVSVRWKIDHGFDDVMSLNPMIKACDMRDKVAYSANIMRLFCFLCPERGRIDWGEVNRQLIAKSQETKIHGMNLGALHLRSGLLTLIPEAIYTVNNNKEIRRMGLKFQPKEQGFRFHEGQVIEKFSAGYDNLQLVEASL